MTVQFQVPAMLDILVIAAHPDDAEIGVGGTIATLIARGTRIGILDLTSGEPTPHGTPELRQAETAAATQQLGVSWRENLGLPNRSLQADLASRRLVAEAIRKTRPRLLFAPYWEDSHPDHVAASSLVDAARFWAKLTKSDLAGEPHYPHRTYYYFSVHLRIHPQPTFVFDISDSIDVKMRALGCYHSQFVAGRSPEPPTPLDSMRDYARYWGWAIGVKYGEPFVCRETLGLNGFRDVV